MSGAMTAENVLTRPAITRLRPVLCLLLALPFAAAARLTRGLSFTAPAGPVSSCGRLLFRAGLRGHGRECTGHAELDGQYRASAYRLSRSKQSDGPWSQIATPAANSFTDKG